MNKNHIELYACIVFLLLVCTCSIVSLHTQHTLFFYNYIPYAYLSARLFKKIFRYIYIFLSAQSEDINRFRAVCSMILINAVDNHDQSVSTNSRSVCLEVINPALTGRALGNEQRQHLMHNGQGLKGIIQKYLHTGKIYYCIMFIWHTVRWQSFCQVAQLHYYAYIKFLTFQNRLCSITRKMYVNLLVSSKFG